jgi:hypothetical protein
MQAVYQVEERVYTLPLAGLFTLMHAKHHTKLHTQTVFLMMDP